MVNCLAMRVVIQRVLRASVTMKETGERREIGPGLVTLFGVGHFDAEADADKMAEKVVGLRIFGDAEGKMNLSLREIPGGAMLIVSQFTLLADTRKGRRPSFHEAALPPVAVPIYERFVAAVRDLGISVQTGEFGAEMLVEIVNDGPVTLVIDSLTAAV